MSLQSVPRHVQFAIIGAGQAGNPLARALSQAGHETILIEANHLGGSCVNFGCTPTKAVIASAEVAHLARSAKQFGLTIPQVKVDFPQVLKQAMKMVKQSRKGLAESFENLAHFALVHGRAKLEGRDSHNNIRIRVTTSAGAQKEIIAEKLVLNLGTHSDMPEIPGLKSASPIHAENWLAQKELPKKLVIIGSGYIGVEMAQFYSRMGSEVTLIEKGSQILSKEDEDVALALEGFLKKEGVKFFKNASVEKVERKGKGLRVHLKNKVLSATHLFIASGRKATTEGIGLETLGIELDKKGFVVCDSRLATSAPNVWVAGDLRGGPCFTHTAWDDFRILKSFFLEDGSRSLDRIVPYAIFTDPELGRVGLTEKEAKEKFPSARVGKFKFSDNGKATEIREAKGFIKLIAHPEKDELLGAAVLGAHGSETVQLYVTLMNAKAPYSVIRGAIYIHPTLAEAAQSVVSEIPAPAQKKQKVA